jgi:chromosome segregation ATPase
MKRTEHELKQRLQTMRTTIDEMHRTIHELEVDKIRLGQQQKKLRKKINKHKANMDTSTITLDTFAKDQTILANKKLTHNLLKRCTRLYIDQTLVAQQRLGGFMTDLTEQTVHPFEFRMKNLTREEVADKLWQVMGLGSSGTDEWHRLFFGSGDDDDDVVMVETS